MNTPAPLSNHAPSQAPGTLRHYCAMRLLPPVVLPPNVDPGRARVIMRTVSKWPNRTVLTYGFMDGPEPQKEAVRAAFAEWKALGLGISFAEVSPVQNAQIRIAFRPGGGSWSYIGTDCKTIHPSKPTMSFGWDLTTDYGHTTALHEIGHALGLPHEHQNPKGGIVWNEEAVYASLGGQPNNWDRTTTFNNILSKIKEDTVQGSQWDPDSVMHYAFDGGLIVNPPQYATGLTPAGGLSARDKAWVHSFYPEITADTVGTLSLFQTQLLALPSGGSASFDFVAPSSRRFTFQTLGLTDTELALSKDQGAQPPADLGSDDDSGDERNARLTVELQQGDRVRVQVRVRFVENTGEAALMVTTG
nr:M12 family metallopeptidase [uncultured Albidiferax sp.]